MKLAFARGFVSQKVTFYLNCTRCQTIITIKGRSVAILICNVYSPCGFTQRYIKVLSSWNSVTWWRWLWTQYVDGCSSRLFYCSCEQSSMYLGTTTVYHLFIVYRPHRTLEPKIPRQCYLWRGPSPNPICVLAELKLENTIVRGCRQEVLRLRVE